MVRSTHENHIRVRKRLAKVREERAVARPTLESPALHVSDFR